MVLEQSTGSVLKFLLDAMHDENDALTAYYRAMPENFMVPSALFPTPEVEYHEQTLCSFISRYIMFITIFGHEPWQAHEIGLAAHMKIHTARDKIPLLLGDGAPTKRVIRVRETTLRPLESDEATAQLMVTWDAPYDYYRPDRQKMVNFHLNLLYKPSITSENEGSDEDPFF